MSMHIYAALAVVVVAVLIYLFLFFFSHVFRFMLRFLFRMTCGIGVLSVFNMLATAYGVCVGLNIYTCSLCGLLGLPGYILLMGTGFIC